MAYEAPSLARLDHAENARWPHRDHTSDGWIGDAAHQKEISDHNPDAKTGVVRATDRDIDGIHVPSALAARLSHPATEYVIHKRRIWSRKDRFRPRAYKGKNAHLGHIHESISHTTSAENARQVWQEDVPHWPTLRRGAGGTAVAQLQAWLNAQGASLEQDGSYGPATESAVRTFQRKARIKVDGVVGSETRGALGHVTLSW
jgi:hypothetical protein